MSDSIEVKLSPDRIVLNPGEKGEISAEVRNAGDVVEVFSVEVEGIEAAWYKLSVTSVSLFPGDKETVRINLSPPLASASGAGSYSVTVKVSSRRDPSVVGSAVLNVDIGKVSSYELDLTPKKVRGRKGNFDVVISNTGNLTNTYKIEATDPEEMCTYGFKSDTVAVEAGSTGKVPLTVSPKKKSLTGAARTFRFAVKVTPVASEVKVVEGALECPALLPKWALMAAGGALAVIVLIIILVVVLSGGGPGFEPISQSFKLGSGDFKMVEVKCCDLGNIQADVSWEGEADRLSLVLYGPAKGTAALARHEDASPLSIDYAVKETDLEAGDSWRVYVANLSENSDADVTLDITYVP